MMMHLWNDPWFTCDWIVKLYLYSSRFVQRILLAVGVERLVSFQRQAAMNYLLQF